MSQPNFFLVGAPKCGTTALCHYLNEHPNVFLATPKEPHYFATDLAGYREVKSKREYERLFAAAAPHHRRLGEASVFYLYSQEAPRRIHDYAPHSRIIVMLRNPVDLVTSLHAQLCYSRDEDEKDLAKAWRLVHRRRSGACIPPHCRDHQVLFYDEIARFGEQCQRWLRHFPREQIKFVRFDDFAESPGRIYRDVLAFLELPDDGRVEFPRINGRKKQRVATVADFTERTPRTLVRFAMDAKRILGIRRWGVLDTLRRWNTAATAPARLSTELKQDIVATYEDDLLLLAELIGIDVDAWLEVLPPANRQAATLG